MRVLVVEDEPTLARQLFDALSEAGYAVDTADNGRDALHLGEEESFDAVVLDLGLPLMDGLSVLGRWRSGDEGARPDPYRTRCLASEGCRYRCGADDYLTKPFHIEELLARVRALIRRAGGHASALLECGPLVLDSRAGDSVWKGSRYRSPVTN